MSSLHGKDQHGGHVYQKALLSHDCRSTCVLTFAFTRYIIGDMGEMGHSCQKTITIKRKNYQVQQMASCYLQAI